MKFRILFSLLVSLVVPVFAHANCDLVVEPHDLLISCVAEDLPRVQSELLPSLRAEGLKIVIVVHETGESNRVISYKSQNAEPVESSSSFTGVAELSDLSTRIMPVVSQQAASNHSAEALWAHAKTASITSGK